MEAWFFIGGFIVWVIVIMTLPTGNKEVVIVDHMELDSRAVAADAA